MSDYGINIGSRRSRNIIAPVFSRDFIANQTLNHGTGPNLTCTRSTTATFFTSTGVMSAAGVNVPRFEYGNFRTNLITESTRITATQDNGFTNWSSFSGTVLLAPSNITSPAGIADANLLATSLLSTNGHHKRAFDIEPYTTYTFSIYYKPANWNYAFFWLNDGSGEGNVIEVNLSAASIRNTYQLLNTNKYVNFTSSISSIIDGWVRVSTTFTTITGTTIEYRTYPSLSAWTNQSFGTVTNSVGNGIDGVYLWGPQLERGYKPTNYIPTTTSPVTTGELLGLLTEQQSTNELLSSTQLWNWPLSGSIDNGRTLALDGTNTAYDVTIGNGEVRSPVTASLGPGFYTCSIFAKRVNQPWIRLKFCQQDNVNPVEGWFNLDAGTTGTLSATGLSATGVTGSVVKYANGWNRLILGANLPTTTLPLSVSVFSAQNDNSYTADPNGRYQLWGAQLERDIVQYRGGWVTSFIPTTNTSITRTAETVAAPASSFYNEQQGTLYCHFIPTNTNSVIYWPFGIWNLTSSYTLRQGESVAGLQAASSPLNQRQDATINNPLLVPLQPTKLVGSYTAYGFNKATLKGNFNIVSNKSKFIIPNANNNSLEIGSSGFFTTAGSGYIRQVQYYTSALSDNRLRLLTLQKDYDYDALMYCWRSGATDIENIDAFVRGVKALNLWNSMVCWPLCNTQNAGVGPMAYSLGGLGTFNGSVYGNPAWQSDGINFDGVNDYIEFNNPFRTSALSQYSIFAIFDSDQTVNKAILGSQGPSALSARGPQLNAGASPFGGATPDSLFNDPCFDGLAVIGLANNLGTRYRLANTGSRQMGFAGFSGTEIALSYNNEARQAQTVTLQTAWNNNQHWRFGSRVLFDSNNSWFFLGPISFGLVSNVYYSTSQVSQLYTLYKSTLGQGLELP
jgi:hypothetical protein